MTVADRRAAYLVWAAVLSAAVAIRFHGLELRSLWHDEAMSLVFASLGPAELAERLRVDSSPPLYYLVLGAWVTLFGDSVASVRSLSAICGVALVAAVGVVGTRFFGARVGLAAALLCAVSPAGVYYSQEARAYALLSLVELGTWVALLRAQERSTSGRWLTFATLTVVALLTHYYGFFTLGAQALWLVGKRDFRTLVSFAKALGLVGLAYFPWLGVFLAQLTNPTPVRWMEGVWAANGPTGSLWASWCGLSPGGILPDPLGSWAIGATSGVILFAILAAAQGRAPKGRATWLFASAVGPAAVAVFHSTLVSPVYVPGRLELAILPGFCLAWGFGLVSISIRPLRLAFATFTVGVAALTVAAPRVVDRAADDRHLAADVAESAERGDLVIATSLTPPTLKYYLHGRPDLELRWFPESLGAHLGNWDETSLLEDRDRLEQEAFAIAERIESEPRSLWIAYAPGPVNEILLGAIMSREGVSAEERGFYRLTVLEMPVVLLRVARGGGD